MIEHVNQLWKNEKLDAVPLSSEEYSSMNISVMQPIPDGSLCAGSFNTILHFPSTLSVAYQKSFFLLIRGKCFSPRGYFIAGI